MTDADHDDLDNEEHRRDATAPAEPSASAPVMGVPAATTSPQPDEHIPPILDDELARPSGDQVMIATRPDGVVALQGPPGLVEQLTARMERVLGSPKLSQATQYASMLGSSIDAIPGVGEDTPRVYQFSQGAIDLLRRNGLIGSEDGVFSAAGNAVSSVDVVPDWMPIPTGADLIQLQTAAVGLALHASIKSLTDAVERVEKRVDELRDLVRSGQVGEVLGHHRVIAERLAMVEAPDSRGLGETDWAAVAHLHPSIVAALERTRYFIRSRMGITEPGRMVRSRVDAAEKLIDANLADALGLLATCEHNLASWQRIRLDRVIRTEPVHLDSVLTDIQATLELHRNEDQLLVNDLIAMIDGLMEPTGLEGLEMIKRRQLIGHVESIHASASTFARQRGLALPEMVNADLPGFRASTAYVAGRSRDGGKWALERVKRSGSAARRALPGGKKRSDPPPPNPAQRSPVD